MSTYGARIVARLREAEVDLGHRRLRQGVIPWVRAGSLVSLLSVPRRRPARTPRRTTDRSTR